MYLIWANEAAARRARRAVLSCAHRQTVADAPVAGLLSLLAAPSCLRRRHDGWRIRVRAAAAHHAEKKSASLSTALQPAPPALHTHARQHSHAPALAATAQ